MATFKLRLIDFDEWNDLDEDLDDDEKLEELDLDGYDREIVERLGELSDELYSEIGELEEDNREAVVDNWDIDINEEEIEKAYSTLWDILDL